MTTTDIDSLAGAIAALRVAFPARSFPDQTVALYGRLLSDLDGAAVARAVQRLLNRDDFLPTIAAIRRECAEEALGLPPPEAAWDIATHGSLKAAPREVREAAESVGGRWTMLHTEHPHVVRAQFLKSYGERRRLAIEEWVGGRDGLPSARDMEALGPTMRELPPTDRFNPRPVHARWLRRATGQEVGPPTEEEKAHAIEVLREPLDPEGDPDPIYQEAERVFVEASE